MDKILEEISGKVQAVTLEGESLTIQTVEGISKTFILNQESVMDDSFHESLHSWLINNSPGYQSKFSSELFSKLSLLQ